MARILFCWELGGALGHLSTLHALAVRLQALGHELHLATSAAMTARALQMPVSLHAVPTWRFSGKPFGSVRTYAHVLSNVGYADSVQLAFQLRAWKETLGRVRPDVLVCESSPTALLAARGMNIPTVNVGTGFSLPPRVYPMPDLHHWEVVGVNSFADDEDALTATINTALAAEQLPSLSRLYEIFQTSCTAICSVPELDAYGARPPDSYIGEVARLPGLQMPWPVSSGKRVFAYLKSFPELLQLLMLLRRRDVGVLIYAPAFSRERIKQYQSERLHFADRPLDVSYMLREASLVVTHGHGLTLQALQAGVPVLCLPMLLEQHILARRVDALRVGSFCSPWRSNRMESTLDTLLNDERFTQRARAFASRYAHLDPDTQATRLATRIAALTNKAK